MTRLAFLTLEDRSGYVIDDELAIAELTRRGFDVREIPWSRDHTDWSTFDLVIVRTTWDYHKRPTEFLAALARIEASGTTLENPRALITWNLDKRYLRDLAARGVPTVPSIWGHGGTAETFAALFDTLATNEIVVKPIVSANALDTFRLHAPLTPQMSETLVRTFTARAWVAQPFLKSIVDDGELSIFYFDGQLSHAVRKVPKSGDFRVQEEHGGNIAPVPIADDVRRAADDVIQAVTPAPFQARADLVRLDDGSLALMELELIEPSLYFRTDASAPGHFADAVVRVLERHASSPH
jgi:glutathione synthase/RimK-type ligase-like ATP-grasp enzyme